MFFRNKGFASHFHVLSGDDDLFVIETATKQNTSVCLTPDSFTYSKAKTSLGDWLKQKKRHLSTGSLYKSKHKVALGLFFICQVLFYPLLLVLLISKFKIVWVAGVFALRLLIQLFIFGKSMQRLKEKDLIEISYSIFYYGVSIEAKTTLVHALKHHGEETITKLIEEFRKDKTQYDKEIVYFGGHINRLGHYFRHLAKVAEYIEKANFLTFEDKKEYFRLFRAQLSHYELIIFFVSNFIEIGKGWEKSGLISKYKLIKSLPEEISDGIKPKKYHNIEFDWEKYSVN